MSPANRSSEHRLALLASGSGSNAEKIMEHFREHPRVKVALVLSNKPDAPVLEKAARFAVPTYTFDRPAFYESDQVLNELRRYQITFIALAGFLWQVPANLVAAFPNRIVNIHPALLPKFGGKGMYGQRVHEAVVAAGETESGITIHYVNEHYDEGAVVFQARRPILPTDSPTEVARNVLELEHQHYPLVIERLLTTPPGIP